MFSTHELQSFTRDGFVVVRRLITPDSCRAMLAFARSELAAAVPPLEYEADVRYPGAPSSHDAPGGATVRRLLQAYARSPMFAQWATCADVRSRLRQVLREPVMLSQAHHNCVMTKDPRHSSSTGWHRDVRYWAFEQPDLVSVWLALDRERQENGCLLVLPGSHAMEFAADQLDDLQFLRTDAERNRDLLARATAVELDPGDVLFFHGRLFHAAGRNQARETKFSLVFTYHAASNRPVAGSRSASQAEVAL